MGSDRVQHSARIGEHLDVFEANHANLELFEHLGSYAVVAPAVIGEVTSAVKFDGEFQARRVEVEYEDPNAVLAPELDPVEPAISE